MNPLAVEYHRQDTDRSCGSASAQMVLNSLGAGLIAQNRLLGDSRSNTPPAELAFWYTPPDGLTEVMNDNDPRGPGFFNLYENANNVTLTNQIIYTIDHYNVAPIALVFDQLHWIVVYDHKMETNPPQGQQPELLLLVNNPAPELQSPVNHGTNDFCTTDGHVSDIEIPLSAWLAEYLTPVINGGWAGRCLAVCDPTPADYQKIKGRRKEKKYDGKKLLLPETAAELAVKALTRYSLFNRKIDSAFYNKLAAGKPLLVKRLGKHNDYYYIVPLQDAQMNVLALVNIDARYGNLREAGCGTKFQPLKFKPLPVSNIVGAIGDTLKLKNGLLQAFPEVVKISPFLVWKPCRESLSPFLPFYHLHIGTKAIYVSMNGKVHTRLYTKKGGL